MNTAWPKVTLGDVCELKYGRSLPEAKRSGSGFGVFGSNGEIGRHERALTDGTTIVVGRKGSFGEVTYSTDACWPIDTTYYVDRTSTDADLRWLYYRMRALHLSELNRAAAIPGLNREDAYAQPFLLPTVEEQRRIASILDAADALRVSRGLALAKLDKLARSFFHEMFEGSHRFTVGKLGEHVPTTSGGTPSRSKPEYFRGDIPWVKSGELASGFVVETEERITEDAVRNSSAKLMPPGTVLLAMYGATVGAVATLGIRAATNQAICCLSPTPKVTGPYLVGFLRSVKSELLRRAAGGAQPNISQSIIRDLELPLAPLELQLLYGERVAAIAPTRARFFTSSRQLDALFAALQQRAFRGEL